MRILIAEDSLTQAVDLRRRLEAAGHQVVVAADGLKAWNLLQAGPEPLLISDWMMPEMNGPDLCRKIRAEIQSPYIYIILLTAKSHRHERLQGLSAGADDFLSKPVDSIELDIALRTAQRILATQEALRSRARELERSNEVLTRCAAKGPLTGLRHAPGFQEALASACREAEHDQLPVSLVRLEIETLEWLLDSHDLREVLAKVGHAVQDLARPCDIATRHGKHGFALLLRGFDLDQSREAAEMLRSAISRQLGPTPGFSTKLGVATWSPGGAPADPATLLSDCEADLQSCPGGWDTQESPYYPDHPLSEINGDDLRLRLNPDR
jgi:two-component system chemotaxis response regulator CheY